MKKWDITPLIMWLILFLLVIALAGIRLYRISGVSAAYPVYLDALFVGLYLLWMLVELRVTKRDTNTEGKRHMIL